MRKRKFKPTTHTTINIHCPINLIVIDGSQNPVYKHKVIKNKDVIDVESTSIVKHPQQTKETIGNDEIIDVDYTEVTEITDVQSQKTKFSMKKVAKIATATASGIAATASFLSDLFDLGSNLGTIISSDTFSNTVSRISNLFSNFF